eukprot:TRINITY_DN1802_c0_g1_i2.p1 TRINITY_DN1802_c0_g1~~TRINITY_DN1802_c0_g1_i2.p1  ORF type:complete len:187 (+),score=34.68 TRINITY_DN1802_c0_g1_i2:655-1215(+)
MGRNKIKIEPLKNERSRQATFTKRKNGLMKKAMELSILCDCEVALIVFGHNGKVYQYSTSSMEHALTRFKGVEQSAVAFTNEDVRLACLLLSWMPSGFCFFPFSFVCLCTLLYSCVFCCAPLVAVGLLLLYFLFIILHLFLFFVFALLSLYDCLLCIIVSVCCVLPQDCHVCHFFIILCNGCGFGA